MPNYSSVILVGHMTRDPEQRHTQSGKTLANFGVAVNDPFDKSTAFVDCTAWGNQADYATKYLVKGSAVLVAGRIKQESWTAQDGSKRSKLCVVAERVEGLTKRDVGDGQPRQEQAPATEAWPGTTDGPTELPF